MFVFFSRRLNAGVRKLLPLSRTALKPQTGRCSVLQLMGTLMNTQTLSQLWGPGGLMGTLMNTQTLSQLWGPGGHEEVQI